MPYLREDDLKSNVPSSAWVGGARGRIFLKILFLAALVAVAYYPSVHGGFILDDELATENPMIRAADGLKEIWTSTKQIDYWPVTYSTFWIEWRLWNNNPTGYHVVNDVLHVFNCLLVWLILRKMSIPGAFFAAALFAVHPVNVESVAWIIQRKTVLAMLFFLLSIYGYIQAEARTMSPSERLYEPGTKRWYGFSLAMFVLAMLSKGSVAILPLSLLVVLAWRRRIVWKDSVRLTPFFAMAAILTVLAMRFQPTADISIRDVSVLERILGAMTIVWFYIQKALMPVHLCFVYPQWDIEAGEAMWWIPLCATAAITIILERCKTDWSRGWTFARFFYYSALIPVMGFTDISFMQHSLVADHYQYVALVGFTALMGGLWSLLRNSRSSIAVQRCFDVFACGVLVVLTALSWQQSGLYRDAQTLYTATLEKNPQCWLAYNNLAKDYRKQGKIAETIDCLKKAAEVKPGYAMAQYNLGTILVEQGDTGGAIVSLEKAVQLDPAFLLARVNLGVAYQKANRLPEAVACFEETVKEKPIYPEIHATLAMLYAAMHRNIQADASARTALQQALAQGNRDLAQQLTAWLASREKER